MYKLAALTFIYLKRGFECHIGYNGIVETSAQGLIACCSLHREVLPGNAEVAVPPGRHQLSDDSLCL